MFENSPARHYHKDLIGRALFYTGAHRHFLGNQGIVLAYHSISDERSSLICGPNAFRNQCRFLKKYFDVVAVHDLLNFICANESLDGKVAITFDDGYKDNSEVAADILVRYSLPATFFVATRFINSNHVSWWDEQDGIKSRWMNWNDVRALSQAGFTIGGHTQHHVDLGSVSPEVAHNEISGCREDLRRELGIIADMFAFPYGGQDNINDASLKLIQQAGFKSCFSCHGGIVDPVDSVFELARLPISSWHISEYHLGAQIMRDFQLA